MHVLHQQGDAEERQLEGRGLAEADALDERVGLGERLLRAQRDDRVQRRVVALDPIQRVLDELPRRHLPGTHDLRQLAQHGIPLAVVDVACVSLLRGQANGPDQRSRETVPTAGPARRS